MAAVEPEQQKSIDDEDTLNMFDRSMTLSSECSDSQLKAKLSVQTFFPKFQPSESTVPESESNLAAKSEGIRMNCCCFTARLTSFF